MMKWQKRIHVLLLVSILAAVLGPFIFSLPPAHAASQPTTTSDGSVFNGTQFQNCGGIEIHLTGADKFDLRCLPKQSKLTDGHTSPLTNENSDSGCSSSDIAIHLNINYNDTVPYHFDDLYPLCINGSGSISNFKNIIACEQNWGFCSNNCFLYDCLSYPTSWNDVASSFTSGSWWGRLYWNANSSGDWVQFNPNESCANMGFMTNSYTSGPTNFNDVISSIWVGGSYSEGRIVC